MNHVSFDYTLKIITYDKRNYIDKNEMFTKKKLSNSNMSHQHRIIRSFLVFTDRKKLSSDGHKGSSSQIDGNNDNNVYESQWIDY